ncbi:MAG: TolC family protein [Prevotella sp.]|nr:TolC family protein [Prevotella sp.]
MKIGITIMAAMLMALGAHAQKKWTLKECIDYAIENNVTLKQVKLKAKSAQEDVKQSRAALLPTVTASTNQGVGYSPFDESGADKTYYSGSYNVNAQWTVWNGGQNTNALKINKLTAEQSELSVDETSNDIQETVTKLFVQILYMTEAIEVNRQSLETSKKNEERGRTMVEVGKMSKADLAQLTAQRVASEYAIVESETQLSKYKQQLKNELELLDQREFDIAIPTTSDQQALVDIPAMLSVYQAALMQRPEVKNAQLGVESSKLQLKSARAGHLPTVTMSGSASTSTNSMSDVTWGQQMKRGLGLTGSVIVSVPIIDGRKAKTSIRKAKIAEEQAVLSFQNEEDNLYYTIEGLWLDAVNNQQKFISASASVDSEQASYDLLQEQFNLGLKNIVELLSGKDKLLTALQNKLQSKYMTILNIQLLKFYEGKQINI